MRCGCPSASVYSWSRRRQQQHIVPMQLQRRSQERGSEGWRRGGGRGKNERNSSAIGWTDSFAAL
jgi:hypothetical protein